MKEETSTPGRQLKTLQWTSFVRFIISLVILGFSDGANFIVNCGNEKSGSSAWLYKEDSSVIGPVGFMPQYFLPMFFTLSTALVTHYYILWDSGYLKVVPEPADDSDETDILPQTLKRQEILGKPAELAGQFDARFLSKSRQEEHALAPIQYQEVDYSKHQNDLSESMQKSARLIQD